MSVLRLPLALLLAAFAFAAAAEEKAAAPPAESVKARVTEILAHPDFQTSRTEYVWKRKGGSPEAGGPGRGEGFGEQLGRIGRFLAGLSEIMLWSLALFFLIMAWVNRDKWLRLGWGPIGQQPAPVLALLTGEEARAAPLPADVAEAASALWERGDAVGCLSLLYRGALSGLAQQGRMELAAGATEEECIRAVEAGTPGPLAAYFRGLARAWQGAAYASRIPGEEAVRALLAGWKLHFGEAR